MSDTIIAQKREGTNNTVHLYRPDIVTRYSVLDGEHIETRIAYCSHRLEMRPDGDILELTDPDLSADYVMRDNDVVGKICENCRKTYQGVCPAND